MTSSPTPSDRRPARSFAAVVGGLLLVIAGARLALIHRLGTGLPFWDQWEQEAQGLILPWLDGRLSLADFFAPHNDHWPVIPRLWSFALFLLHGQWNNQLEAIANIPLAAASALVLVLPLRGRLGGRAWLGIVFLAAALFALPFSWENTLWGIQSVVYFLNFFSLFHLWAVTTRRPLGAAWWLGYAAGVCALLSLRSGVLAAAVSLVIAGWRAWREPERRRAHLIGCELSLAIIVAAAVFVPSQTAPMSVMDADSVRLWLDVWLRQLAWPVPHPAAALLIWLPFAWFSIRLLRRRRAPSVDWFILGVGGWVLLQAAAIAYGRAAETTGFVSRYTDHLAPGLWVNAACLLLWFHGANGRRRRALAVLAVGWCAAVALGLGNESVNGHAGYAYKTKPEINRRNIAAVKDYLRTGDPAALSFERIGETLYSYPPTVIALLNNPRFRAFLPPDVQTPPVHRGRLAWLVRGLPPAGWWLFAGGLVALAGGGGELFKRAAPPEDDPFAEKIRPPLHPLPWIGGVTLALWVALLFWPRPFDFDHDRRLAAVYHPSAPRGAILPEMRFHSTAGMAVSPADVPGAVDFTSVTLRREWYGTYIHGDAYTGILTSDEFPVIRRHLFALLGGYPNWPGNGIRWRLRDPATGRIEWISVTGVDPVTGLALWDADVSAFQGWQASLWLYDGHTDNHTWVGITRPVETDDANWGRRWLAAVRGERAEETHRLLAACAVLALGLWTGLAFSSRKKKGKLQAD